MTRNSPTIDLSPKATRMPSVEREGLMKNPTFGTVFTEHMVKIVWKNGEWQKGAVVPYGPLSLSPATSALHYGQSIFEGLKAYRHVGDRVFTFRPDMNAKRFAASARRLAMPELPPERFVEAIDSLVDVDRAWVPGAPETSLYIRPIMFATEAVLGVRPANEYLLLVFASPVGAYFPRGVAPVNVWVSTEHVRAAPHGTGAAKCAGNYAASLEAQAQAREKGCDQVLYLDATKRELVEELGGMNFFMVLKRGDAVTLVTPDLSPGTLLAGVTRDSVLRLAPDLGYAVEERPISVTELKSAYADGTFVEAFACGTAAVVNPIGTLTAPDLKLTLNEGRTGAVTQSLRDALIGIQYGLRPDSHGWLHPVE